MQKRSRQTWFIGIFTLLVLVAGVVGYQFLKGQNFFSSNCYYYAYFNDIGGLYVTNRITINGLTVGRVSDLTFVNDGTGRIRAQFSFPEEIRLQHSTRAEIANAGLIGGSIVRLHEAYGNGPYLAPGDTIPGVTEMTYTQTLSTQVGPLLSHVDTVVRSLKQVLRVAEKSLTNERAESLYAETYALLSNLRRSAEAFPVTMENANASLKTINGQVAQIGRRWESALDSLQPSLAGAIRRSDTLLASASQLLQQMQAGEGSMGKLLQDDQLYHDFQTTVRALDSILAEVKQNPRRYFNFSIF